LKLSILSTSSTMIHPQESSYPPVSLTVLRRSWTQGGKIRVGGGCPPGRDYSDAPKYVKVSCER
jgi:hypothetical protein